MHVCPNCESRYKREDFSCPRCSFTPDIILGFPAYTPELTSLNDSFPANSHDKLFSLEEKHFWFSNRRQLLLWTLEHYFPEVGSFCEVGCGTGYVLSGIAAKFPNTSLTGVEIYSSALPLAASRGGSVQYIQADICQFPFEDEFEVVGSFDVLEHIENDELALENIFRSLRPGGGLIVTVPQHKWLWSDQDVKACHKRRYTRNELLEKLGNAGFVVEKYTSFVSLLLPLMLFSRLLNRSRANEKLVENKINELDIKPFLNNSFSSISFIERCIIKLGLSLPIGGSLLCVGRKV